MKKFIITSTAFLLFNNFVLSQGCIVVRNISAFGQYNLTDNAFTTSDWQLNITSRYFKAFRDFKGKKDQKTPKQNETIVNSFSTDISLSRLLKKGGLWILVYPFHPTPARQYWNMEALAQQGI